MAKEGWNFQGVVNVLQHSRGRTIQEDAHMADDKTKRDFRDRDRVSADEDYEVEYFAKKVGLTVQQVRELIKKHGNDRATLEREAKAFQTR
jgi:hypothetical protein